MTRDRGADNPTTEGGNRRWRYPVDFSGALLEARGQVTGAVSWRDLLGLPHLLPLAAGTVRLLQWRWMHRRTSPGDGLTVIASLQDQLSLLTDPLFRRALPAPPDPSIAETVDGVRRTLAGAVELDGQTPLSIRPGSVVLSGTAADGGAVVVKVASGDSPSGRRLRHARRAFRSLWLVAPIVQGLLVAPFRDPLRPYVEAFMSWELLDSGVHRDARREAQALDRAASLLTKATSTVRCPRPLLSLTTSRLLVMRRAPGIPLADVAWGDVPDDTRRTVAGSVAATFFDLLEAGILLADPGPSNFLVDFSGGRPSIWALDMAQAFSVPRHDGEWLRSVVTATTPPDARRRMATILEPRTLGTAFPLTVAIRRLLLTIELVCPTFGIAAVA